MKHTFLFQEGVWKVEGQYFGGLNNPIPLTGEIRIAHTVSKWLYDASMQLLTQTPVEFQNLYEIVPFEEDGDTTSWKSYNPEIGRLYGRYMIVDDSILSMYQSEGGEYMGMEYMLMVNKKTYKARGYTLHGKVRASSWSATFTKVE
jgi:hypothetical protein